MYDDGRLKTWFEWNMKQLFWSFSIGFLDEYIPLTFDTFQMTRQNFRYLFYLDNNWNKLIFNLSIYM